MREIKFRGLTRTGRWVYGSLVIDRGDTYIYWRDEAGLHKSAVLPDTIGQYTGLRDKNGREIYEGDIVKYQLGKYKDPDGGYGPDNWEMFYETAEIVYDESKGRFKRKDRFHDFIDTPECEIIGNIYENPELLNEEPERAEGER